MSFYPDSHRRHRYRHGNVGCGCLIGLIGIIAALVVLGSLVVFSILNGPSEGADDPLSPPASEDVDWAPSDD